MDKNKPKKIHHDTVKRIYQEIGSLKASLVFLKLYSKDIEEAKDVYNHYEETLEGFCTELPKKALDAYWAQKHDGKGEE